VAAAVVVVVAIAAGIDPGLFAEEATRVSVAHFVVASLLGVLWFLLGVLYLRGGVAYQRSLLAWFGLSFLILGVAQLVALPAVLLEGVPLISASVLRAAGYACALAGVLSETGRMYRTQGSMLHELALATERERTEQAIHRHEARNALHLIEAATVTIERHRERLEPTDRESLERAMRAGVERLQRLYGTAPGSDGGLSADGPGIDRDR
jgi:hypothetical protein